MKKLVIDIDEVICEKGILNIINKYLGTDYSMEYFKSYIIDDIVGGEKEQEKFYEYLLTQNIYDNVEFIEDAYNTIRKLNDIFEIYICSAYVMHTMKDKSGIFLKDKFDWLYKNFSFINPSNFIFTGNKKILKCDIQIDDRIQNFTEDCPLKLLFTAYHNKTISLEELKQNNVTRVNSWQEVHEILKEFKD